MPAPGLAEMLNTLIATPSVSCTNPALDMSNRPVLEQLAPWLEDAGFNVEWMDVETPDEGRKANLIATKGKGDGGLILAGHSDTVPCDPARWSSDPFTPTERDGRLYGLGSADMKSFLALAIEAARHVKAKDLKAPLIILATCDEETSMSGAKALVQAGWPKARHAVIGEPTGLKPVRLHKGILMEGIRVIGQAGHSSDPSLGNSALEGMLKVMNALVALRGELQARYSHPGFDLQQPTMNLGCIHGGDNPNRICGQCELHIDLRLVPGMSIADCRAQIRKACEIALRGSRLTLEFDVLFDGTEPLNTDANAEIVRLCEQLTGHNAASVSFGTEAPYLTEMGISTVVMGPGFIDQAHQPDEFLPLDQAAATVDILRTLIQRCCIEPE